MAVLWVYREVPTWQRGGELGQDPPSATEDSPGINTRKAENMLQPVGLLGKGEGPTGCQEGQRHP